jgi:hypothetical protein
LFDWPNYSDDAPLTVVLSRFVVLKLNPNIAEDIALVDNIDDLPISEEFIENTAIPIKETLLTVFIEPDSVIEERRPN